MSLCVVGLTGGIGSGKSFVASCFRNLGAPVLDADDLARQVVEKGTPGLQKIAAAFGADLLTDDGRLDRAIMRRLIFENPDARRRLEAIVHPLVRVHMATWRNTLTVPYGLYVAPLLVESGMHLEVDRLLVIDVPESVQMARVSQRDGLDGALIRRIMDAQASRATRLAQADDILDNTLGDETILPQIGRLHALYLQLSGQTTPHG